MRVNFTLSTVVLTLLHLVACKEPNPSPPPSLDVLFTQNKWKLTAWTSTPAYPQKYTNGTTRLYTDLFERHRDVNLPCLIDEQLDLRLGEGSDPNDWSNKFYSFYQGKVTCNKSEPLHSGSWYTVTNKNGIYLYIQDKPQSSSNNVRDIYKIEEVSNGRLVLSQSTASPVYVFKKTFTPL